MNGIPIVITNRQLIARNNQQIVLTHRQRLLGFHGAVITLYPDDVAVSLVSQIRSMCSLAHAHNSLGYRV